MASIQDQLSELDYSLTRLLELLKEYTDAELNRAPAEDKWSPLQVMHHLMQSEKLSHSYIRKKSMADAAALNKAGLVSGIRKSLLGIYLGAPFRFKAPEMVGDGNLPVESSFWPLAREWRNNRKALREFIDQLPPEYLDRQVYRHPFAGRMGVSGMLFFFQKHFDRHSKQIFRSLPH